MYFENINGPEDVKKLSEDQLNVLAEEIRDSLLKKLSKHGGHFGPNFGMVEATIAMHYVFESPKDKIVYDVSHQSYPHKMLTGRKDAFLYEEHYDDVSGYSNPGESEHDHFTIGHTSTSISLALGLAKARDLKEENGNVIAVIGDGSLSGGEALEGLDYAAELGGNLIIVVNDNDMSIAENHGGLYDNLAEEHKEDWHYCAPFDVETGKPLDSFDGEDFSSVTAQYLLKKMKEDKKVVAITSATPTVMGFTEDKRKEAGKQFIDVGIAEETAMAMAAGIAAGGGKPVYGVYSTFVQRTYDQITQDLCIDSNAATIVTFWGSVYGMNDVTHLGLQDIPMMSNIPNLVYLAPTTKEEYLAMLDWSIDQDQYPVAIKLPGGEMTSDGKKITKDFSQLNKYEVTEKGSKVAVIGLGTFYNMGCEVAKAVEEKTGTKATVINPYYITGIDEVLLEDLKKDHDVVITLEDGFLEGGFGEKIARFYGDSDVKVLNYGVKKELLDRYDIEELLKKNHLTVQQIVGDLKL